MKIEKNTIIITSGGRTGTLFFKKLFNNIEGIVAFHEPESLNSVDSRSIYWIIKKFGLLNTTFRKLNGQWGITNLSNNRIYNQITSLESVLQLATERKSFIESFREDIYVESSYHFYGLLDIIPETFSNVRTIFIVRNGKDWVRSWMNTKGFYNSFSFHTIFKTRINPDETDDYYSRWRFMTRFERICWAWQKINSYASITGNNSNTRIFKFEDLFCENSSARIFELIEFALSFDNFTFDPNCINIPMQNKINKSKKSAFPSWDQWSKNEKTIFTKICGETMEHFNYAI